ncbi:right-handed parallel beta-helix repeat-containing protein, partial [Vibrio aerogenes]
YADHLLVGSQYHMTLSRNNSGFQVSVTTADGEIVRDIDGAYANIVQMIEPDYQYVGFAAARNVKMHVTNATLDIDAEAAQTVDAPRFVATPATLRVEMSSPTKTAQNEYTVQARANYSGVFSVIQDDQQIAVNKAVAAGDLLAVKTTISGDSSDFVVSYTGTESGMTGTSSKSFTVTRHTVADPAAIYVSPEGSSTAQGTASDPLTLKEALQLVAPGGTIHLLDGEYASVSLSQSVSGSEGALKSLVADGDDVVFTSRVSMDANYWHFKGMEVAQARLRIKGSHNIFEDMKVHDSPDTGFQISSGDSGRALWASDNQVINVESYNNMDSSRINADGFAAKMRVGDGNTFINCISHHNIDDGWDLFNKVEDGEDGVVTIKDSVSYSNGRTLDDDNNGNTIGNGFKLGGEGLPVAHVLENNVSYNNNMDGVTDNFNSGSLKIQHVLSVDNARFNFLIRKSPYDDSAASERTFEHNVSARVNRSSSYNDVVYAHHTSDNWLMEDGQSLSDSGEGLDQALAAEIQAAVAHDDGTAEGQRQAALALKALNDARNNSYHSK